MSSLGFHAQPQPGRLKTKDTEENKSEPTSIDASVFYVLETEHGLNDYVKNMDKGYGGALNHIPFSDPVIAVLVPSDPGISPMLPVTCIDHKKLLSDFLKKSGPTAKQSIITARSFTELKTAVKEHQAEHTQNSYDLHVFPVKSNQIDLADLKEKAEKGFYTPLGFPIPLGVKIATVTPAPTCSIL